MKQPHKSLWFFYPFFFFLSPVNEVLEGFLLDQTKCSVSIKPKYFIAIWTFSNRSRQNTEIKFVPKCHFEQRQKFFNLEMLKQTF